MPTLRWIISLALLAGAAPAGAAEVDGKLAGTYRFVGGAEEQKALTAAIESVVGKMNVLTRGIARRRLAKGNAPTSEVEITLAPNNITIARTGKPAVSVPTDGKAVNRNTTAGTQAVSVTVDGRKIEQTMHGASSDSTNSFSLAADGLTLTIHTKIVSPSLPAPVEYHMTYARK